MPDPGSESSRSSTSSPNGSSTGSLPKMVAELWDLVRAYAKQETIEPVKGLGRFLAFGVAGSVLLGIGAVFVLVGLLRALQTETGSVFDGNWSWVPYLITLVVSAAIVGLAASKMAKRSRTTA